MAEDVSILRENKPDLAADLEAIVCAESIDEQFDAVEKDVTDLRGHVADLEERVADLEAEVNDAGGGG